MNVRQLVPFLLLLLLAVSTAGCASSSPFADFVNEAASTTAGALTEAGKAVSPANPLLGGVLLAGGGIVSTLVTSATARGVRRKLRGPDHRERQPWPERTRTEVRRLLRRHGIYPNHVTVKPSGMTAPLVSAVVFCLAAGAVGCTPGAPAGSYREGFNCEDSRAVGCDSRGGLCRREASRKASGAITQPDADDIVTAAADRVLFHPPTHPAAVLFSRAAHPRHAHPHESTSNAADAAKE